MEAELTARPVPPTHARRTDEAVRRFGGLGRAWVDGLWHGDPLADAVVASFAEVGRSAGMRMVATALADGIDAVADAPTSLRAFFAELDREPDWVDHDQLDRAGDHLARNYVQYGIVLAAASLLVGYTNPAAAKPLVLTGRLVQHAGVRNLEVADWLREVTTPGGMRRHGLGFERTVRVRLIHAMVRRHLTSHPEWDAAELGTPISQPYMAHTLSEFGCIALDAMAVLGARYTAAERADVDALWRYVGRVSGVEPALLPATTAEQDDIRTLYQLTRPPVDDDSRALVRGLIDDYLVREVAALLPVRVPGVDAAAAAYVRGVVRAVVGDELAEELGVGPSRLAGAIAGLGSVLAVGDGLVGRVPGGRSRQVRRGRRVRREQEVELRERYGVEHELVDTAPAEGHPAR